MNTPFHGEASDTPVETSPDIQRPVHRPRRPLPALVIALMAGMVGGALGFGPPTGWMLFICFFCACTGAFMQRRTGSVLLLHLALALLGMAWMRIETTVPSRDDLRRFITRDREFADVTGIVMTAPTLEEASSRGEYIWRFDARIQSVTRGNETFPATGQLRVRYRQTSAGTPAVALGDRWNWRGSYRTAEPGELGMLGVAGFLSATDEMSQRLPEDGAGFVAWTYALRKHASERLGWGMPSDDSSVAFTRALMLGERHEVDRRVQKTFAQTGTLHILALSGMHIGIIVLLLLFLLKASGINRPHWVLFFVPFLGIYTLGTGATASIVRATIMAIVYFSAAFFRKRPDAPTSLALSAMIILFIDPFQLFDMGFVLTFVVVAGLLMLHEPLVRVFRRDNGAAEPWPNPEVSWWAGPRGLWNRVIDLFVVSLAAWMSSLPLMAGGFNMISPVALLINIPLAPLTFIIMMTASLSLLLSFAAPVAVLFNQANWFFCELLMWLVELSARVPGAYFYVPSWPWYLVLAWFALVLLWVVSGRIPRCIISGLLAGIVVWSCLSRHFSARVEAVMIPAGDAPVMLIDGPGARATLIDAGSAFRSRAVVQALRNRGINQLDDVWLTRATSDAYGGLALLLDEIPVGRVIAPDASSAQHHYNKQRERWAAMKGVAVVSWPTTNRAVTIHNDVLLRVMYPPSGAPYRDAKESSMMLHISHGHSSIFWMGQAGEDLESAAMAMAQDYRSGTLAVGMIDSVRALSDAWLSRVQPERVVLAVRAFDRMPQGAGALLQRLDARDAIEVVTLDDHEPMVITLGQ